MKRSTKLICAGVDAAPKVKGAAQIIRPFHEVKGHQAEGLFASRVWLATEGAEVVIYENGVSLGSARRFYDDPDEAFSAGGRRWQYVEFFTDSDPNNNGRHYWA